MRSMKKSPQARVFISCGQREGTEEYKIAEDIVKKLEHVDMGFDAYFAGNESTLKGVKEMTLRRLSESEYFIFIDFKRERLYKQNNGKFEDTRKHRGSLFSHQELAIATLFDIEFLLFREKDVIEYDGISKFIHAYSIEFPDRKTLSKDIIEEVKKKGWTSNWRKELLLERSDEDWGDAVDVRVNKNSRWYHIKVRNLHQQKIARDCVAYLEKIKDLSTGEVKPLELVEFKWKGVNTPRVAIPSKKFRYLDAFHIYYDSQNIVHLGINPFVVDFTGYYELYRLSGPGTFELTYVVFSENLSPARATFSLHIGDHLDDIKFYKGNQ